MPLDFDAGHGVSIKLATRAPHSRTWTGRLGGGRLHEPVLTEHVLRTLSPGDTFVDVGAHLGWFSLLAAARGARVLAFEMQAGLAPLVQENVELNGFEERVSVIPCGLGSECGLVPYRRRSLSAAKGVSTEEDEDVLLAPCLTLDVALAGIRPALIKIDVEGFEGHVLEGGAETLARHRPPLVLELHDASTRYGHSIAGVLRTLDGLGYRLERFASHRREDGGDHLVPLAPGDFDAVRNDAAVLAH